MLRYKPTLDKGIMHFIKDLNKAGFKTAYSCEGHGQTPYVSFRYAYGIKRKNVVKQIAARHRCTNLHFATTPYRGGGRDWVRPATTRFSRIAFKLNGKSS